MKLHPHSASVGALVALGLMGSIPAAHAALVIGSAGQVYNQNFDTLTTSAATGGQPWVNDSTLAGWSLFVSNGTAAPTLLGGTGSVNTGSFYSFGATASTERALGGTASGGTYFGSPGSGAVAGWIAASLQNNTGSALDGFSLSFDGEQWRNGGNTNLAAQTMVMQYGFGSTFAGVSSWSNPGATFDWSSVVNTSVTNGAAVDGNAAGLVAGRGGTVNTTWNAGDTLWLRWIENNDVGFDHGLAIDNVQFTAGQAVPSAVPLPPAMALMAAGMGVMGWIGRRRREVR